MGTREKSQQLGMPFSTANYKLHRIIIFDLLVKFDKNICFKCNGRILDRETLTIEHKEPWLHVSAKLFWDVDNIAFSHLKCNKPDRPYIPPSKKGPNGTSWCYKHKKFLPNEQFTKDKYSKNGLNSLCKACDHYWRK